MESVRVTKQGQEYKGLFVEKYVTGVRRKTMKTLHLTLSKKPFEVMVTGEKKEEFRKGSDWIVSRLFSDWGNGVQKEYDVIKFVNGYGSDKPYFICKYDGFVECYMDVAKATYSNGLVVEGMGKGDFVILCGEIIEKGNLREEKTK
jgi:hypothetical protein